MNCYQVSDGQCFLADGFSERPDKQIEFYQLHKLAESPHKLRRVVAVGKWRFVERINENVSSSMSKFTEI
jgi:hypothetical protein